MNIRVSDHPASSETAVQEKSILSEKIDGLNALALENLNSNVHHTMALAEEARQLSSGAEPYLPGLARALLTLGAGHYRLSNNEEALEISREAIRLCEELNDKKGTTFGLNTIGAVYINLGDYAQALEHHLISLSIREEISDHTGVATSLMNVGNVYYKLGDFPQALDHYLRSLKIREEIGDISGIGTSLTNIGNIYSSMGDNSQALHYLLQSLAMKEQTGNKQGLGQTLVDIANEYLTLQHTEKALEYAKRSLGISQEFGNKLAQSYALYSIAKALEHTDTTAALDYYQQSLRLRQDIVYPKGETETLLSIGMLLQNRRAYREALPHFRDALALAEEMRAKPLIYRAHQALAACYEQMGRIAEAFEHYKAFHSYKEEVYNEESDRKTKNLQVIHHLEQTKKEAEIYRLRNGELSAANAEILRQQTILEEQAAKITQAYAELQKRNLELEQLNHEKNEFLGIAAHDMKNPLAGIILNASTVKRNLEHMSIEDISRQMTRIEQTAERMESIVGNLLDIHAIESGTLNMTISSFSIGDIVQKVVDEYRPRADVKNIIVQYDAPAQELLIHAHETSVSEIVENLLSNAIKYSPWEKNIRVKAYGVPDGVRAPLSVRVEVQDEGPGLSEEDMNKVFGKFARLSARPTGGEHSTGLGLSIVRYLVEMMKGRVWCESTPGEGATFIMELPVG